MSSTSGFVYKTETPLCETVTGYPYGTEYYQYPTTVGQTVVGTTGVVPTTTVVESTVPFHTYKYVVDVLNVAEDSYLTGHQIDGRVLYPTTGYLYLVWKSLAKMNGFTTVEQMPITFENVEIHRATILAIKQQIPTKQIEFCVRIVPKTGIFENVEIHRATILAIKQQIPTKQIEFCVRIVPKTGIFELFEGENVIVTGRVAVHESIAKLEQLKMLVHQHLTHLTERKRLVDLLEQEEIYRELRMRGYDYNGEFQPILRADLEGSCGELLWTGKWIPFLDALFQLNTLSQKRVCGGVVLPTRIRMIKIDPFAHFHVQKLVTKMVKSMTVPTFRTMVCGGLERPYVLPVVFDPITSRIVCGGVEIVGVHTTTTGIQTWLPTTPVSTVSPVVTPVVTPVVGTTGLINNFVPYVEKHFGEEYVVVDKCGGVESEPMVGCYKQNREFLEFYLNECKRYISHIWRKIEQPTVVLGSIVPTVIPKTIEQQLECLKLVPTTTTVYPTVCGGEFVGTPYGKLLESGKLLQLLCHVANIESTDGQYLYKIQKIFAEKFAYLRALEEDCILNLVNNRSYYLKSILDTVLENTHHIYMGTAVPRPITGEAMIPRLKVLEISPSMGHFFGAKVSNLMRLYPNRVGHIDYHYVPSVLGVQPTTVVPEEYICELNKQLPYEIKKVEWNFGLKNGSLITEVPSHLREYDLVILNGGLSSLLPYVESEYELKKWLQTVVMEKVLKPQGFLFVHEYTNSFDFMSLLNKLEQTIWTVPSTMVTPFKYTTGRFPYHKYQSEMQWRQLVEECGFYPVCMKSDVELSSMLLYRRPLNWYNTVSPVCGGIVEEKILIDGECGYEQWIKKVRVALVEKAIERVWLLSEREPTVELISLINTLRREIGGEKIRCLFLADRQPVCVYGQRYVVPTIGELLQVPVTVPTTVVSPWTELFSLIRKADLIMNVFRCGQWGSFRPVVSVRPTTGVYPVSPVCYPFVTGSTYPFPVPTWSTPVGLRTPWTMTHLPVGYPFEWTNTTGYTGYTGYPVVEGTTTTVVPTTYPTTVVGGVVPTYVTPSSYYETGVRRPFVTGGVLGGTVPRVVLNPLQTYIITCGLGSFGLELVEWCVEHGARRIVVTSKYGVRTGYQARKLRILRDEFNATIQVLPVDVREEVECLTLIKEAIALSVEKKIGGIFHLGSHVEDVLFEQQYPVQSQIHEVLRKITDYRCQGAFNLDKLTRGEGIMDEMAYFVLFSPVFSQLTVPTVLEKICESRRRIGRHGFTLQWGCGVENGLTLEQMFSYDNIVEVPTTYVVPSRVFTCMKIFETLLHKSFEPTMWSHYVPCEKYWLPETVCPITTPYHQYMSGWTGCNWSSYGYPTGVPTGVPTYKSFVELLLTVLGVKDCTRIVGCETLGELGLDSVLALELKQFLETFYMTPLSLREIPLITIEKLRMIESRYPQGIFELYHPRPLTYFPRLRSVIVRKTPVF